MMNCSVGKNSGRRTAFDPLGSICTLPSTGLSGNTSTKLNITSIANPSLSHACLSPTCISIVVPERRQLPSRANQPDHRSDRFRPDRGPEWKSAAGGTAPERPGPRRRGFFPSGNDRVSDPVGPPARRFAPTARPAAESGVSAVSPLVDPGGVCQPLRPEPGRHRGNGGLVALARILYREGIPQPYLDRL